MPKSLRTIGRSRRICFLSRVFSIFHTPLFLETTNKGICSLMRTTSASRRKGAGFGCGGGRRGVWKAAGTRVWKRAKPLRGADDLARGCGPIDPVRAQHEGRVAFSLIRRMGPFPCCRRRRGKCFARSVLRETVGRRKVCWPFGGALARGYRWGYSLLLSACVLGLRVSD